MASASSTSFLSRVWPRLPQCPPSESLIDIYFSVSYMASSISIRCSSSSSPSSSPSSPSLIVVIVIMFSRSLSRSFRLPVAASLLTLCNFVLSSFVFCVWLRPPQPREQCFHTRWLLSNNSCRISLLVLNNSHIRWDFHSTSPNNRWVRVLRNNSRCIRRQGDVRSLRVRRWSVSLLRQVCRRRPIRRLRHPSRLHTYRCSRCPKSTWPASLNASSRGSTAL